MVTKRDLIVTAILTFCLTSMLFIITETKSASPYNPWADINGDGKVDLADLVILASCYGTSGTPINKTEMFLVTHNTPYINPLNQTEYAYPRSLALNLSQLYILQKQGWENETGIMWGGWDTQGHNVTFTLSLNMAFFDTYAPNWFYLGLYFSYSPYVFVGVSVDAPVQSITVNGTGCLKFLIVPSLNGEVNWLDTSTFGNVEIASLLY